MPYFDFTHWNGDLLAIVSGFGLAAVQKLWSDYKERRTDTYSITHGHIDRASSDTANKGGNFKCVYSYRVGEERFTGSFQKHFDDQEESALWADALANRDIPVRYDPGKPARSRLREVDLEPIARAFAPAHLEPPQFRRISGWKTALASAGVVLAICGLAITVTMLLGEYLARPLVSPWLASVTRIVAVLLFMLAGWSRLETRRTMKPASWMKYCEYAFLYYALFATFLPAHPGTTKPGSRQQPVHHAYFDARYYLFFYFSIFEVCYAELHQPGQEEFPPDIGGRLDGALGPSLRPH